MNLNRKDEDNLEGKVIVWARCSKSHNKEKAEDYSDVVFSDSEKEIHALYASIDREAFMKKLGISEEEMDKYLKLKGIIKRKSKETLFYVCPIPVDSEDEINLSDDDNLFMGDWNDEERCKISLQMGVDYYALYLQEQVQKAKTENPDREKKEVFKKGPITYKEILRPRFLEYFSKNYILPMIDCAAHNDIDRFKALRTNLIQFSRGSPFHKDVIRLCELIEQSQTCSNSQLISCYVNKISAIHEEKYEIAGQMKKEIEELESPNRK
jgi:hypothetical protein